MHARRRKMNTDDWFEEEDGWWPLDIDPTIEI